MRLIDADALKELFSEVIGHIAKKPEMNGNLEHMIRASAMVIQMIDDAPTVQPDTTTHDSIPAETGKNDGDGTSGDCISRQQAIDKFIDGLEEIFSDIRERHVDDSVCGLCEYDGAYIGQSGEWCNECPGFEKDDCFKLSGKIRKEWTDEIIKAFPSVQPDTNCSEIPNNSDTVSRHEAIDALKAIQTYKLFAGDDMLLIDQAEAQTELMMLPSAEPEIIRCKDCKYYREYGYVNGQPKFLPRCTFSAIYVNADDFCSKAERREE